MNFNKPGGSFLFKSFILLLFFLYGCSADIKNETSNNENNEINLAVKSAYGLENKLWEDPALFKSRDDVKKHFQKGFCDSLANELTDYYWVDGKLQPSDPVMLFPDSLKILKAGDSSAVVYYYTSEDMRESWGLKKFMLDSLRLSGGSWKIISSQNVDTLPLFTQ